MNEERGKRSPDTKTAPNRPTLQIPIKDTTGTGSLTPKKDMDSSVLLTIRHIHDLFMGSVESSFVEALEIEGNESNFEKVTPGELVDRTIYSFLKDAQIVLNELKKSGIAQEILEKARKELETNKSTRLDKPSSKK